MKFQVTTNPIANLLSKHCCLLIAAAWGIVFVMPPETLRGQQDVVTVRLPGKAGSETIDREGQIVEWKGGTLTLMVGDNQRELKNEDIVDVKTSWPASYAEAQKLLHQGQVTVAIEQLKQALAEENRRWVDRLILADLVQACRLIDRHDEAAKFFLELLRDDPNSRFLNLAPLPWGGSSRGFSQSKAWMQENSNSIVRLVGASWSTAGPERQTAEQILADLTSDLDPRVSGLAIAQTWRLRPQVSAGQLEVWAGIVKDMHPSVRAAARLVLAEHQARAGQADDALINWMKVVTLSPDQQPLVAASLFRAGQLLQQQQKIDQATTLYRELQRRFPESLWATQVPESLEVP